MREFSSKTYTPILELVNKYANNFLWTPVIVRLCLIYLICFTVLGVFYGVFSFVRG